MKLKEKAPAIFRAGRVKQVSIQYEHILFYKFTTWRRRVLAVFTLGVQVRCMSKTLACHHQCEHTFFPSTHTRILAHSHAWVQSLNLVLNTKWYLGLQSTTVSECSTSLCQWPGTNAWGLSVNTDIRGGENGGLNKLLYDATPNSDTYHFRFRCEEKSSCSVEWEIRRSH